MVSGLFLIFQLSEQGSTEFRVVFVEQLGDSLEELNVAFIVIDDFDLLNWSLLLG